MTTRRAAVIVICVTLASLWPLARGEFTTWDDPHNVSENPFVQNPDIDSLQYHWSRAAAQLYIPITYTVWIGIGVIAHVPPDALNPWMFHAPNLLAHLLACLLVLRILQKLGFSPAAACIGALVFAVHPVQVETVGWISGLKDLLAGMFCLLAIDQFISAKTSRKPWRRMAIALLAFVLAMLSKPSAVALPIVFVAIDLFWFRRSIRETVRGTLMYFVLAIPFIVIGKFAQPAALAPASPIWSRPLIAADAIAFYLGKIVAPWKLGIDYGHSPAWVLSSAMRSWIWIVPVALVFAGASAYRCANRIVPAAIGIFLAALFPVLGFVPFEFQAKSTVADHYLYLSMLGLTIAMAGIIRSRASLGTAVIVVAALSVRSFVQTRAWQDSRSLYLAALNVNPRSIVAYENLFVDAMRGEDGREAEWAARGQLSIAPDDPVSQLNLGAAMAQQRRFDDAADAYRTATRRWPQNADAHFGLALALTDSFHPRAALAEYDVVSRLDPNRLKLFANRARAIQMLDSAPNLMPGTQP